MRSPAPMPHAHRWSSAAGISSSKGRARTAARRSAPLAFEKRTPAGGAGGKLRPSAIASIGFTPGTGTWRPKLATTPGAANGSTSVASQRASSGRQCAERKTISSPSASAAPRLSARPNVKPSRCSTRTGWRASSSSVPSREPESSATTSKAGAPCCASTASSTGPRCRTSSRQRITTETAGVLTARPSPGRAGGATPAPPDGRTPARAPGRPPSAPRTGPRALPPCAPGRAAGASPPESA